MLSRRGRFQETWCDGQFTVLLGGCCARAGIQLSAHTRTQIFFESQGACGRTQYFWEGAPRHSSGKAPALWATNMKFLDPLCPSLTVERGVSGTIAGRPSTSLALAPAKARRSDPLQGEASILSSCAFLAAAYCMAASCYRTVPHKSSPCVALCGACSRRSPTWEKCATCQRRCCRQQLRRDVARDLRWDGSHVAQRHPRSSLLAHSFL